MNSKKAILKDIALYAIFLVAAIVFYFYIIPTQTNISIAAKADVFSPDTFPKLLAGVIAAVSVIGLIYSAARFIIASKNNHGKEEASENKKGWWVPYAVVILILAYIICFNKIGFIPATIIFPPLVLFVIGGRNWKHYLIYFIFAAAMYVLFKYVMYVPIR